MFAGNWNGDFNNQGGNGNLWSASHNPTYSSLAFYTNFYSGSVSPDYSYDRSYAFSLRCLL